MTDEEQVYARVDAAEKHLDPETTLGKIHAFVEPGQTILDVGCGGGRLAKHLRAKGVRVVGIERNPTAAALARNYCERVEEKDLTSQELLPDSERFSVIVCADVLEHLADPAALLARVVPHLAPGGTVVVSVPNVAYYKIRCSLLAGRFDYEPSGIMDQSHLRFFTRKTILELLRSCGLEAVHVDAVWGVFFGRIWRRFPRLHAAFGALAPQFFAIQWVIRAVRRATQSAR
jgi:2-polyprenyl-3-methyl-5-hydroxy-6-metoxy-1,4-benzoquinol methylase